MWPLPFRVWGVVEIAAFELDSSIAVRKPHICHFSNKTSCFLLQSATGVRKNRNGIQPLSNIRFCWRVRYRFITNKRTRWRRWWQIIVVGHRVGRGTCTSGGDEKLIKQVLASVAEYTSMSSRVDKMTSNITESRLYTGHYRIGGNMTTTMMNIR